MVIVGIGFVLFLVVEAEKRLLRGASPGKPAGDSPHN
jgi:hypothetical protein